MKLGIMQPYFFPYIGYWQLLNAVDKYVIFDDVNFINRGWINRNRILVNNEVKYFNIQLKKASQNKKINEIEVMYDQKVIMGTLRTICNAYNKAPYFKKVYPIIEKIFLCNNANLAGYLKNSIIKLCEYMEINTEIFMSSDLPKDNNLRGQEKILSICKTLGADIYINAIGGQDLYDKWYFENYGINLLFLKTLPIEYKQTSKYFIPNLSIVDFLMFNSKNEINDCLKSYKLIQ